MDDGPVSRELYLIGQEIDCISKHPSDSERLAHPSQKTTLQLGEGLEAVVARDELTARMRKNPS
jgi:hypothetical protein